MVLQRGGGPRGGVAAGEAVSGLAACPCQWGHRDTGQLPALSSMALRYVAHVHFARFLCFVAVYHGLSRRPVGC